ncbi:MAG: hypothetical protein ACYDCL_22885 [Myxococcales bacterium]
MKALVLIGSLGCLLSASPAAAQATCQGPAFQGEVPCGNGCMPAGSTCCGNDYCPNGEACLSYGCGPANSGNSSSSGGSGGSASCVGAQVATLDHCDPAQSCSCADTCSSNSDCASGCCTGGFCALACSCTSGDHNVLYNCGTPDATYNSPHAGGCGTGGGESAGWVLLLVGAAILSKRSR